MRVGLCVENIQRYNNYRKYRPILEEMGIKYLTPDGEEPKRVRGSKRPSTEGAGDAAAAAAGDGAGAGISADTILSVLSSTVGGGGAAGTMTMIATTLSPPSSSTMSSSSFMSDNTHHVFL